MYTYPNTRMGDTVDNFHGTPVADPYRWLEENSEERELWLGKQANLTHGVISSSAPFRNKLRDRFISLSRTESMGMPSNRNGRRFFSKRDADQELAVAYVQMAPDREPEALLDPNSWSKDNKVTLAGWWPSPQGNLVAYAVSDAGNDKVTIRVMNVVTKQNLSDTIPDHLYPMICDWDIEEQGFWYHRRDPEVVPAGEEKQHQKIFFHAIGNAYVDDKKVFSENVDKQDYLHISVSDCNRYLLYWHMFTSRGDESKSIYIHDRQHPDLGLVPIVSDTTNEFDLDINDGWLYSRTDMDAPRSKIVRASLVEIFTGNFSWQAVIPEADKAILSGYTIVDEEIYVAYLEDVSSQVEVFDLNGLNLRTLPLPACSTWTGISSSKNSDEIFFGYCNFFVRHDIFRIDKKTRETKLFYRHTGGLDPERFEANQEWFTSKDGTRVPMFVIHKKGIARNGNNPTLLYGYGGFRISIEPGFSSARIPFLEAGGVYVIANLRGGSEFGEEWYKAGVLDKKQNVFDDFIAAAEFLISSKYTSTDKLAIFGWSNGGLLTSACELQRPDLFRAVIVGAPVADMMRYHKFDGGYHWMDNYGKPEDSEHFKFMIKYSPVHNVRDGVRYPATLVVTADQDDRTHPMHALKFGAAMQKANSSDNPILMLIERKAGHGGAASVSNSAEQSADIWSFIFWQLGITFSF